MNKPTATVSIWVDGVEKQEVKKDDKKDKKEADKKAETTTRFVLAKDKVDKPASKLTFGAVEGKEVVVKRQAYHKGWDETALVKTPDFLLEQAKQGPLAYEDKELPNFNRQIRFAGQGRGEIGARPRRRSLCDGPRERQAEYAVDVRGAEGYGRSQGVQDGRGTNSSRVARIARDASGGRGAEGR